MSKAFNVRDANTRHSRLLDKAHAGEEIILTKAGKPHANGRRRDPHDRISAAQAQFEQVPSLSADPCFAAFPIETLW